ncbi:Kinetochore protein NDC80 homolog [Eumeta japonica]|uniref:Kinetochore protein NDC80 n=1 Tax=Eumeta variegata TaxID=151549 RepID=A0A4C1TB08_EUMVA|nr:Kinetochore protein NDC80 homolog [Eumeta japonica]
MSNKKCSEEPFSLIPAADDYASRVESKPSLLPRPRRTGSIEARSSSAEARSRAPLLRPPHPHANRRSRSQQGDGERRTGVAPAATPLRSATSSLRYTSTPKRTPSEERKGWQASLERALACVTVRDTRPLQNQAWQRAQASRIQDALAARSPDGNVVALVRPLTIQRFVEMTGVLLSALMRDHRLTTDNYVARLPHLSKRLLYPGAMTKSWLSTVNTLHTFPQALAFLAYLVDIVARVEVPVDDDWLYAEKDNLARLQRDYFRECWIRFQEPEPQYDDLIEEYVHQLKLTLGDNDEKIAELRAATEQYRVRLDDELEAAARADEARRAAMRADLQAALRAERTARVATRASIDEHRTRLRSLHDALRAADVKIESATAESLQLRQELQAQPMSVAERTRLLEEVDYANRVIDSQRALADQVGKMVIAKENDLALWQKKALDACIEYKQGLIHLSADPRHADLAALAIDEKELMGADCAREVGAALDTLKRKHTALGEALADLERERRHCVRRRAATLEETRTALDEARSTLQRERLSDEAERARDAADATEWNQERRRLTETVEALRAARADCAYPHDQLAHWEAQDREWRSRLADLRCRVVTRRAEATDALRPAREARARMVLDAIRSLHARLDELTLRGEVGVSSSR